MDTTQTSSTAAPSEGQAIPDADALIKWIDLGCPGADLMSNRRIMSNHIRALARPAVVSEGPASEYGWLVENGKDGDALRYRTWEDGMPAWTADHDVATRYARRIDAERAHQEDEDAWRIVQHAWDSIGPAAPAPEAPTSSDILKKSVNTLSLLHALIERGADGSEAPQVLKTLAGVHDDLQRAWRMSSHTTATEQAPTNENEPKAPQLGAIADYLLFTQAGMFNDKTRWVKGYKQACSDCSEYVRSAHEKGGAA